MKTACLLALPLYVFALAMLAHAMRMRGAK
jgi:hypothetical protein